MLQVQVLLQMQRSIPTAAASPACCFSPAPVRCCPQVLASITALQPCSLGKLTQGWTAGGAPQVPCNRLGLGATLQRCTTLLSIDLSGLYRVASDQMLQDIAASCPQLQHCRLSRCICLTTAGLEALVDGLPGLCSLSLLGCNGLGGALAVGRLRQLEELELSWCQYVDARAVSLGAMCSTLGSRSWLPGFWNACQNPTSMPKPDRVAAWLTSPACTCALLCSYLEVAAPSASCTCEAVTPSAMTSAGSCRAWRSSTWPSLQSQVQTLAHESVQQLQGLFCCIPLLREHVLPAI